MSTKNPAAVALGKKRWQGTTEVERSEAMRELAQKRTSSLSPERRAAIAKKASAAAAKARKKRAKAKNSTP